MDVSGGEGGLVAFSSQKEQLFVKFLPLTQDTKQQYLSVELYYTSVCHLEVIEAMVLPPIDYFSH